MRTLLALLAALLLLASQARAQALQEAAGQVPAQDPPVATGQDLPVEEDEDDDEDVAISFQGADRVARKLTGFALCKCRRRLACKFSERHAGRCGTLGLSRLCCR